MVSAWASKARAVFGQLAVDEKSNEITAVPELLELLDIEGCIVTADAMSCQKEIAGKIIGKGADYVLGLKDNQKNLSQAAQEQFEAALSDPALHGEMPSIKTEKKGHGRQETRTYYVNTDPDFLGLYQQDWKGLKAIGMMESMVEKDGKCTKERHYHLLSIDDVNEYALAARSHWGVESSLHWCLDVTFREDHSRMRADHTAENFSVVRHIVLNVLKSMDDKMSVARRRRHCAYDDDYLEKVIRKIHA